MLVKRKTRLALKTLLTVLTLFWCSNLEGLEPQLESITPRVVESSTTAEAKLTGKHFEPDSKIALILREAESPIIMPSPTVTARGSLFGDSIDFETEGEARHLLVKGNHLFVGLVSGLWILDIGDPLRPEPIRLIPADGMTWGITISGNHLYLGANERGLRYWYLKVVDIANPKEARPVGWDLFPGAINALGSAGPYLFVGTAGVQVLDVKNPLFPEEIAFLKKPNDAGEILVIDDHAYVCGGMMGGLYVVDIHDPARPAVVGVNREIGSAKNIFSGGNRTRRAYTTAFFSGDIHIVDLEDPVKPKIVGEYKNNEAITDGVAHGKYIYITDKEGLKVIDVENPARPHMVGAYMHASSAGVVVDDRNYAYLSMGTAGIQVIRLNDTVKLVDVRSAEEILFQLPTRLLRGTYDILVTNSSGETGVLEAALEVE